MVEKKHSLDKKEKQFVATVWKYYEQCGRHDLPWRKTDAPYKILVSEIMLQQTQVSRVIEKYKSFLKRFPSARRLAAAPLGDVLREWQGLGYNRRAKFLKQAAEVVISEHNGVWPKTFQELRTLPGLGVYTAGAVMNFAYSIPVSLIETNVRTVYIHHFFEDKAGVTDKELLPIIERTLDMKNPREWNWALMDYGAYLKATIGNISKQSKHYTKQSAFKGSDRQIRGAILRALSHKPHSLESLIKTTLFDAEKIAKQTELLLREGMIVKKGKSFTLPT